MAQLKFFLNLDNDKYPFDVVVLNNPKLLSISNKNTPVNSKYLLQVPAGESSTSVKIINGLNLFSTKLCLTIQSSLSKSKLQKLKTNIF